MRGGKIDQHRQPREVQGKKPNPSALAPVPQVNGQNVVKVGHRQVVNMIRQGGNTLTVKVVMVTRHPDMDETVHKKGASLPPPHCVPGHERPVTLREPWRPPPSRSAPCPSHSPRPGGLGLLACCPPAPAALRVGPGQLSMVLKPPVALQHPSRPSGSRPQPSPCVPSP